MAELERTGRQVSISIQGAVTFPDACCCCGGVAETHFSRDRKCKYYYSLGVVTKWSEFASELRIPICRQCLRHNEHYQSGHDRDVLFNVLLLFALVAAIVVFYNFSDSWVESVGVPKWILGSIYFTIAFIALILRLLPSAKFRKWVEELNKQMTAECVCAGFAVVYYEFSVAPSKDETSSDGFVRYHTLLLLNSPKNRKWVEMLLEANANRIRRIDYGNISDLPTESS